jgi:YfiH family protein
MTTVPGHGFEWLDLPGGTALSCRPLARIAAHLFTTRSWPLGSTDSAKADESAAWESVAAALDEPPAHLVRVRQVHGSSVLVVRAGAAPGSGSLVEADVLLSDDPSRVLAIQTADCIPLLIADARIGVVAAAHAGWRGLAARVPETTVRGMSAEFGSQPSDLVAAMGPSISAGRYEVGEDVRARFEAAFPAELIARWFPCATRAAHWRFDGWQSSRDQLAAAGVPMEQVYSADLCTADHADLFCSYRRDGTRAGRMAAAIRPRGKR